MDPERIFSLRKIYPLGNRGFLLIRALIPLRCQGFCESESSKKDKQTILGKHFV